MNWHKNLVEKSLKSFGMSSYQGMWSAFIKGVFITCILFYFIDFNKNSDDNKIKFVKDRPGHDVRYALDSKKIKKKLKWKSMISLKKGLQNTFNWYFKNMKYYTSLKKKDITNRLGIIK